MNNDFVDQFESLPNVPIVQKLYDFYRTFHNFLGKFPKSEKYTLGQNIGSYALKTIEEIFTASTAREGKRAKLVMASTKLDLIKLMVRLAYDTKCIDQNGYIELQKQLQEIGKMLGGWIRSLSD